MKRNFAILIAAAVIALSVPATTVSADQAGCAEEPDVRAEEIASEKYQGIQMLSDDPNPLYNPHPWLR